MLQRNLLGLLGVVAFSASAGRRPSEYYLSDGGTLRFSVVKDGAIVTQWTGRDDQMPIAVIDTIRTYGEYSADFGSEYALDGTWTGTDYVHQGEGNTGQNVDRATDGVERNFLAGFNDGAIWGFDLEWQNPERLFEVASPTGVTFDQASGNLWVISFGGKVVAEYTTGGSLVRSFAYSTPSGWLGALAYEPSTDTLWAEEFNSGTIFQFSKSGQTLDQFTIPELAGYIWGGEFAARGGDRCNYRIKKSKSKGGCEICPAVGDDYRSQAECEKKNDCIKKVKTTIACPRGGNGVCKIKGKRSGCD